MVIVGVIKYVHVATTKKPRSDQECREYWRKKIEEEKSEKSLEK